MLEKMSDFFEARLDGYDEHMMTNIESANEFYPFTAKQLPTTENCNVLDLGCGTGLELQEYYLLNPSAMVTGIDLSQGMLAELKRKFANKDITLMLGSYFDVPFGEEVFDAAVSVESLHHFTKGEKIKLLKKSGDNAIIEANIMQAVPYRSAIGGIYDKRSISGVLRFGALHRAGLSV